MSYELCQAVDHGVTASTDDTAQRSSRSYIGPSFTAGWQTTRFCVATGARSPDSRGHGRSRPRRSVDIVEYARSPKSSSKHPPVDALSARPILSGSSLSEAACSRPRGGSAWLVPAGGSARHRSPVFSRFRSAPGRLV